VKLRLSIWLVRIEISECFLVTIVLHYLSDLWNPWLEQFPNWFIINPDGMARLWDWETRLVPPLHIDVDCLRWDEFLVRIILFCYIDAFLLDEESSFFSQLNKLFANTRWEHADVALNVGFEVLHGIGYWPWRR